MTNPLAIVLGLVILGGLAADVMLNNSGNVIFLSKKLLELIEWLAFWR